MTAGQEEALYEFLDNAAGFFGLEEAVSYIRRKEPSHSGRLSAETEAYINFRNLAFPAGPRRWLSRRGYFEPLSFVISPTRLELRNGILIPGHRCVPFANASLLPQEYGFFWQGSQIPFTTTEGPPEEFYPYYCIFGEEYAPQYVARDNPGNEEAFNSDPYEDPPEVSVQTVDMRSIYRETSFVPGDLFAVSTLDWKKGHFELVKVGKDEWGAPELGAWLLAAEKGFGDSFQKLGPGTCTEEQIAYAYWYGGPRMRQIPAYSLEDFLYGKTGQIETTAYGIESRFWYAGREIPDRGDLDPGSLRPDRTAVEGLLYKLRIPVSEYVIQSYVRDSLFREGGDVGLILERLIPPGSGMPQRGLKILTGYIGSVLHEFRDFYNPFTDRVMGPIRQRAGELHTAVTGLASRLSRGGIDPAWLPRHTFIILSQIQSHTASVLEDLDSDEAPEDLELEAVDNSLDSMIETYEDIKELIDEALDSFRRNKLALIRAGSNPETTAEWLLQLSIGGIDIWRRLIVPETCTLGELHAVIQAVFGWNGSQNHLFIPENAQGETGTGPENMRPEEGPVENGTPCLDPDTSIGDLDAGRVTGLLYGYGEKWTVRVLLLSRSESPGNKPVRCVAGAGVAPPEFIGGPQKLRKIISALETGNGMDQLGARQELGAEFIPGDFDIDACNRSLGSLTLAGRHGPER